MKNDGGGFSILEEMSSFFVNEKEYLISSTISMFDAKEYSENLSEFNDSKKAISNMIHKKLITKGYSEVALAEIEGLDEAAFSDIIEKMIQNNHELACFYQSVGDGVVKSERFAIAFKDYWRVFMERQSEVLKKAIDPVEKIAKNLQSSLDIYYRNPMLKAMAGLQNRIQTIGFRQNQQNLYGKLLQNSFPEIYQNSVAWKNIVQPMHPMFDFAIMIQEILTRFKIPNISEEEKQEIIESHKAWGELGWTILPNAPIKLFHVFPNNSDDADNVALTYWKKLDLDRFFNKLRLEKIKKVDLEEAIFCYENKKYKACALILFGIIDSSFIKQEKNIDTKWRAVGRKAINNYKEKTESENEQRLFMAFHYHNLFCCLTTFFSSTDNFKSEKEVINRNFIGHGMNRRKVRKKDCIQLFVALYNLMIVLKR